ncbi:unnamed protein product [Rotaria sordida]|uniref:Uncharacterized protein n=1 Tax=Rotaria sordida TaxID=392033 RepID=A0A819L808_9BILA|nr:unnamed protein product [Rotaria sordida]
MEVMQVDQYESETSDEEIIEDNHGINAKIKKRKNEVEESIENQWTKRYTNYTEYGRKVYYRYSDKVTCYKTEGDHDHHDNKSRGMDEKVIEELYNDGGMKPKQISL